MRSIVKYSAIGLQLVALLAVLLHANIPHHGRHENTAVVSEHSCCSDNHQCATGNEATENGQSSSCDGHQCDCIECHTLEDFTFSFDNPSVNLYSVAVKSLTHAMAGKELQNSIDSFQVRKTFLLKRQHRGPPSNYFV